MRCTALLSKFDRIRRRGELQLNQALVVAQEFEMQNLEDPMVNQISKEISTNGELRVQSQDGIVDPIENSAELIKSIGFEISTSEKSLEKASSETHLNDHKNTRRVVNRSTSEFIARNFRP